MTAQDIYGSLPLFQLTQACNRGCDIFAQFEGGKPCSCHVRIDYSHCSPRFSGLILFKTLTRDLILGIILPRGQRRCAGSSVPCEKGPQRHSNHAIAVHETGVEKDQAVKNSIRDGLMIHAEKYYFPLLHSRHHDRLMTRRLLAVAEPCTLSQRASPHPNESFKHFRHMFHSSEKGACFS